MSRQGKTDPRITYAKSSDIKGRTYLEYRRDMKRKAIAELEAIEWIRGVLQKAYPESQVRVEKSGGDRFLWFLRGGGVSREPDYVATIGSDKYKIEFQYAEKANIDFYDFKISKVSKQDKETNMRLAKEDVLILYIDKTEGQYALLQTEWIVQNGTIGEVAAWRTNAYRVPAVKFRTNFKQDETLPLLIQRTDDKNTLLEFQHALYDKVKRDLQQKIEDTVLDGVDFRLIPATLEGFFEACVILEAMERCPDALDVWFRKALQFADEAATLEEVFRASFCLDYLYFCKPVPSSASERAQADDSLRRLGDILCTFVEKVNEAYLGEGRFQSKHRKDLCEETRYALFTINVVEDMIQDIWHYYPKIAGSIQGFPTPIRRIYQSIAHPTEIAKFVRECV